MNVERKSLKTESRSFFYSAIFAHNCGVEPKAGEKQTRPVTWWSSCLGQLIKTILKAMEMMGIRGGEGGGESRWRKRVCDKDVDEGDREIERERERDTETDG